MMNKPSKTQAIILREMSQGAWIDYEEWGYKREIRVRDASKVYRLIKRPSLRVLEMQGWVVRTRCYGTPAFPRYRIEITEAGKRAIEEAGADEA